MTIDKLKGRALDWAVAKCIPEMFDLYYTEDNILLYLEEAPDHEQEWSPSTNWLQGGPIIQRERITVMNREHKPGLVSKWFAHSHEDALDSVGAEDPEMEDNPVGVFGPTALVAAMRCFVISKLGSDVKIPKGRK